ncbi:hypothetical protein [Flavobacterium sp.]|jgi:hypothetical protein|uniref:hypothetical protein n=1 Tax=Flavobacterium sp. TaxID=239 RepID=UPI0037BF6560
MLKVTLNQIGNSEPLNLIGSVEILSLTPNTPIVFLIDEHHKNLNGCIDTNIENTKELIEKANVVLVGVESLAGGIEWNKENERYVEDDSDVKLYNFYKSTWTNGCTTFADSISINHNNKVIGVESMGMMDKIIENIYNGLFTDVTEDPINLERSKHYIKTLFENRIELNLQGNLILNCGSNHNSHIEEWINNGEIEEIAGIKASYIRLNAI